MIPARVAAQKNQHAQALGKLGGKARFAKLKMNPKDLTAFQRKGGEARAKSLSKKQRSELARKAVQARWAKAKKVMPTRPNCETPTHAPDLFGEMRPIPMRRKNKS
jgi:hypothetical protein